MWSSPHLKARQQGARESRRSLSPKAHWQGEMTSQLIRQIRAALPFCSVRASVDWEMPTSLERASAFSCPPVQMLISSGNTFTVLLELCFGNSLAIKWLGLGASMARGPGSTPVRGTKILQAMRHGQEEEKKLRKEEKRNGVLPALSVFYQLSRHPLAQTD